MTSPGVRRLYFDDDKGDLHVFDGKDAFWRWYGAPNQYRDPLQTPRVWSKEARTRIAKAVGLPAVTAIDNLLDAYRSVYPNRVHPVEDDGERIQPERDWLEFREHNTWEGETWYMYVRLESESDRRLAERLCAEWGDNYGEWKLDTWQQHRVDSWCNIPYGSYMPCNQQTVMDDPLRERISGLLDMLLRSWSKVINGQPWKRAERRWHIGGFMRVVEATRSVRAWHVQIRVLMTLPPAWMRASVVLSLHGWTPGGEKPLGRSDVSPCGSTRFGPQSHRSSCRRMGRPAGA